ncbi:MAG: hypothetical protein IJJ22_06995, partial [Oscillospiraceae bacterium]|nr:hypothetical protein [Oscillospiraceae bacterium]
MDPEQVAISSITLFELEYGAAKSNWGTKTRENLYAFLSPFPKDGELYFEGSQASQMAVIERHGINGNKGQGLVTGVTMKRGAVATTY